MSPRLDFDAASQRVQLMFQWGALPKADLPATVQKTFCLVFIHAKGFHAVLILAEFFVKRRSVRDCGPLGNMTLKELWTQMTKPLDLRQLLF